MLCVCPPSLVLASCCGTHHDSLLDLPHTHILQSSREQVPPATIVAHIAAWACDDPPCAGQLIAQIGLHHAELRWW